MSRHAGIFICLALLAGTLLWRFAPRLLAARLAERSVAFGQRHRGALLIAVCLVALAPMIYVTTLVRKGAVNVPLLDDWEMAALIVKHHQGQLTFADIFAQQQEARTVIPKLIFIASAAHGPWDVRRQIDVSLIACWFTAAGVFFLLRRSGLGIGAVAAVFWMAVLLIFSPAQFELWLLASGFPSFLVALYIVAGLATLRTQWRMELKFGLCALFSIASTFTLPHGLLAWGLTFPIALLSGRIRRPVRWWAGWAIAALVCVAIYFYGYSKPEYLPQFAPAKGLSDYLDFVLIFTGGGLAYSSARQPEIAAMVFGTAQLVIFGAVAIWMVRRLKNHEQRARILPWLALCAYALASGVLAALGRVGYGSSYALASRYVTFSLWFTIGLAALVAITFTTASPHGRRFAALPLLILIIGFALPYRACARNTFFFLRSYAANARLARAAILFSPVLDTRQVVHRLVYPPDPARTVQLADKLDKLHLLERPLIRSGKVTGPATADADDTRAAGAFESLTKDGRDVVHATGWAALPARHRQADCVVLSYNDSSGTPTMLAMTTSLQPRVDLRRRWKNNEQYWSGWEASFDSKLVPPGVPLTAWAYDARGEMFFRLPGSRTVAP